MTKRNDPTILKITKRIITSAQNTGRCSKSTTAALLFEHHQQREIVVHAVDCDADHQSLSTAYPNEVKLVKIQNDLNGDVDAMNLVSAAPPGVTIIDQRAHQKHHFQTGITPFLDDPSYRFTFLIWPQEEPEVLMDIQDSVRKFGDRVDWLVINNLSRSPTSRFFQNSPVEKRLKALGAGFMTIPALYPATLTHLTSCALKRGHKAIPFRDALLPDNTWAVHTGHRGFLRDWLRTVFAGYDRNDHLLCLPTELDDIRKRTPEYIASPKDNEDDLSGFNPEA